MSSSADTRSGEIADRIGQHLIAREHGPILACPALWRVLGYRSADAFRKAVQRGTVPVETFSIPHRRGRFARTDDVITWLDGLTARVGSPQETKGG